MTALVYLFVFIFGAIVGSFLNVCIYRLPRKLLSYIILRARCRHCGRRISPRYFFVELLTALAGCGLLYVYSLTGAFFVYWFFACLLIAVIFIDIEHRIVPDVISLPGIVIGLALTSFFARGPHQTLPGAMLGSLLGIIAGGGSMFLLGFFGELVFRKEALGGGDVKLMAMTGAFLGWKLTLLTFFMAPLLGTGVGLWAKFRKGEETIPYAPFLSAAAIVSLLAGEKILGYLFRSM